MKTIAMLMVVFGLGACGVTPSDGIPSCQGELVLAFACGPESYPEQDDNGRTLATCLMDMNGDHELVNRDTECTLDSPTAHFHCMPSAYCAARCDGTKTVCE